MLTYLLQVSGFVGTSAAGAGTNAVQTISTTGVPTGGAFTLSCTPPGGIATVSGPIPYNATAAQLSAILEQIYGIGQVSCTGGPLPTGIAVKFVGRNAARVIAAITLGTNSLTGGATPAPAIAATTAGAPGAVLDPDGNGIATGATRWTFVKRTGLIAKTMQVLIGYLDEGVHLVGRGYGVSSWTLNADGAYTAGLEGLVFGRAQADPNLTEVSDTQSILPPRRGDLFLTWLSGAGAVEDFSLAGTNPLSPRRSLSLDPPSFFPDRMEQGDVRPRISGSIPKSVLSTIDIDALLAASTFAAKARWRMERSLIAATGQAYGVWIVMPAAQYIGGQPDEQANRRRYGGSFNFEAAWDEASGYDVQIVLINGVTAIETYV